MAKKVRRAKKKNRSTSGAESTAETSTDQVVEKAVSAKVKETEAYRLEYAYVVKDLRRLFLLSGALFLLLIVINLMVQ
jgi:type III secretory pathway component EscR